MGSTPGTGSDEIVYILIQWKNWTTDTKMNKTSDTDMSYLP